MKIVVLKSVCPPFDPRIFQKELKALVNAGHEVTQICPYDKQEDRVSGVRLLGFPLHTRFILRPLNWARLWSIMRREPAGAYHFSDPELLPLAWLLARVSGLPVVFDCFEHYSKAIMSDERFPGFLRPSLARLYGFLERKIAESLAAVVVPAIDEKGERRFHQVRRLVLVRNFPWQDTFESLPEEGARKRQLVYIGDISESRRGMSSLVEMLSLMHNKDVKLLFIGKVDTPQTQLRLESVAATTQVSDQFHLVGEVPYAEIKSYLVESAVGLIPLKAIPRWETDIPQKMFEYMACRLPFVASDLYPPRKFAGETQAGLVVEPQSAQAFADAVDFLLDHPTEARQMGERGRRAFLEKYNMEVESQKLVALYESLSKETPMPEKDG